jgi:predicted PurR-regulated permease PerM
VGPALRHGSALAHLVAPAAKGFAPPLPSSTALVEGAGGLLEALGVCAIVFFLGLYGAAAPDAYTRVVLALVPPERREQWAAMLTEMKTSLTRWLFGRAVAMLTVGVLVALGLFLMKVPLAGTLGVLAGLLTFVEYVGAVVSAVPALLLAISRGPGIVVGVAVLFTVAHVIEGYILTPLLVRSTVRIPPGYTLSAQLLLGSIFGAAGLTFATPVTILATVLVKRLYVESPYR